MTENNNNKSLIIFLKDGQTLKFEMVTDVRLYEENIISFSYYGISTGVNRRATFHARSIAGWSLEE